MRSLVIMVFSLATQVAAGEPDPKAGNELFDILCTTCHGPDARGGGAMTDFLSQQPADLTQLQIQNGGVFPTFQVTRQIDGRDPLLAHGGEMPLFGSLLTAQSTTIQTETGQFIFTSQSIADIVVWLQSSQTVD